MGDVTLGALLSTHGGSIKTGPFGTTLKAAEYSESGVPVVSVGEVGYGLLRIQDKTPMVDERVVERLPEYVLKHGDIVFGRKGAVDRSAWIREHESGYFLGSDGIRVRIGNGACSRFLGYQLRSARVREWLLQHAAGTTMRSLNQGVLERVPLLVPELGEQRAIAEVLGALDDKIAANDSVTHSAMSLMRLLASKSAARAALSDLAVQSKSSLRPAEFDESVAHFSLPAFDVSAMPEIVPAQAIKSNKFLLDGPCVLVSKLNPRIPRIWNVVRLPESMAVASTEFVVLRPTEIAASVLWAVLSQPEFSAELRSKVAGTSGSHQRIRPAEVMTAMVPDPRTLSDQCLATISNLGEVVQHGAEGNAKLAQTRDELLPLLMAGRVRVRDAEKNVEEAV